jgi:hypothetical protein
MDKPGPHPIPNMPSTSTLTEFEERILLALWKMKGIGKDHVREDTLRADPTLEATTDLLKDNIEKLRTRGFLETATADNHNAISLTPLGLAILRQIEEDKLQELK